MFVTDLGELTIVDTPKCFRNGSPEERQRFIAWVEENFPETAKILGPDIWFIDRDHLALYLLIWNGM